MIRETSLWRAEPDIQPIEGQLFVDAARSALAVEFEPPQPALQRLAVVIDAATSGGNAFLASLAFSPDGAVLCPLCASELLLSGTRAQLIGHPENRDIPSASLPSRATGPGHWDCTVRPTSRRIH